LFLLIYDIVNISEVLTWLIQRQGLRRDTDIWFVEWIHRAILSKKAEYVTRGIWLGKRSWSCKWHRAWINPRFTTSSRGYGLCHAWDSA